MVKNVFFKFIEPPTEKPTGFDAKLWARREEYARFGDLRNQYQPALREMDLMRVPRHSKINSFKDIFRHLSISEQGYQPPPPREKAKALNELSTPMSEAVRKKIVSDWPDSPYVRSEIIGQLISSGQNVEADLAEATARFPDQIIFKILGRMKGEGPLTHEQIDQRVMELIQLSRVVQAQSLPDIGVMVGN